MSFVISKHNGSRAGHGFQRFVDTSQLDLISRLPPLENRFQDVPCRRPDKLRRTARTQRVSHTRYKSEPGAALVKVKLAGICGTDVHLWHGQLPIPLPVILGHETVGVIEELGEGLEKDLAGNSLAAGDRIAWSSSINCNECYYCRTKPQPTRCLGRKAYGISYSCNVAPHLQGGYADYIYLRPGTAIFKIPEELPTEAVIGAGCALVTSLHGIERIRVDMGDNVVVQGSGPVGLAALAVAKASGAAQTIVFGGPPHRLEIAKRFGADVCIDVEQSSVAERKARVLDLTGGFGADVVLECVGIPAAVPEGVESVATAGAIWCSVIMETPARLNSTHTSSRENSCLLPDRGASSRVIRRRR